MSEELNKITVVSGRLQIDAERITFSNPVVVTDHNGKHIGFAEIERNGNIEAKIDFSGFYKRFFDRIHLNSSHTCSMIGKITQQNGNVIEGFEMTGVSIHPIPGKSSK
jgi:hypothetical protein